MPLIPSPRHSRLDLLHWGKLERHDAVIGASPRMERMGERAAAAMQSFADAGPCYVGVSWGKDSVVVASIVALYGLRIPIVWLRWPPVENPDCLLVRDAFLERFPGVAYDEVTGPLRWSEKAQGWRYYPPTSNDFQPLHEAYGSRYITGIRSEESGARKRRQLYHGVSSRNTCAPITRWSAVDVFAWSARHGLPVHPTYGCSWGGARDRRLLRVDELDGERGKAWGSEEWEGQYYGEEIERIRQLRMRPEHRYPEDGGTLTDTPQP